MLEINCKYFSSRDELRLKRFFHCITCTVNLVTILNYIVNFIANWSELSVNFVRSRTSTNYIATHRDIPELLQTLSQLLQ